MVVGGETSEETTGAEEPVIGDESATTEDAENAGNATAEGANNDTTSSDVSNEEA